MIETLRGRIASKDAALLLQVGPVAFRLEISGQTATTLPDQGADCTVFTELHVREDRLDMLGFATREERAVYRILTGISGVGKRLALAILSELSCADLALVVARGEEKRLTGVSGVGKKTASRLLLELGNRLDEFIPMSVDHPIVAAGREGDPGRDEALLALTALGMSSVAAQAALAGIEGDDLGVEDLIKQALSGIPRERREAG